MQRRGEKITLLDVRDLNEVNLGKIPGTLHISRGNLETKVEALIPRDAQRRHLLRVGQSIGVRRGDDGADGLRARGVDGRWLSRLGRSRRRHRMSA